MLITFCKLSEVMPDVFPALKNEKLIGFLNYFDVFADPYAAAYLKQIPEKDDRVKLMLFYHYHSDKNGEYNPALALEYGCQQLLSKSYMDPIKKDRLFANILELLIKEKQAIRAFDLARSMVKTFNIYTLEQSAHKLCSLILFSAKQNYEPAIQELQKIPFHAKEAYRGDYFFYMLSQKEFSEIQEFLESTNNMPSSQNRPGFK